MILNTSHKVAVLKLQSNEDLRYWAMLPVPIPSKQSNHPWRTDCFQQLYLSWDKNSLMHGSAVREVPASPVLKRLPTRLDCGTWHAGAPLGMPKSTGSESGSKVTFRV